MKLQNVYNICGFMIYFKLALYLFPKCVSKPVSPSSFCMLPLNQNI